MQNIVLSLLHASSHFILTIHPMEKSYQILKNTLNSLDPIFLSSYLFIFFFPLPVQLLERLVHISTAIGNTMGATNVLLCSNRLRHETQALSQPLKNPFFQRTVHVVAVLMVAGQWVVEVTGWAEEDFMP